MKHRCNYSENTVEAQLSPHPASRERLLFQDSMAAQPGAVPASTRVRVFSTSIPTINPTSHDSSLEKTRSRNPIGLLVTSNSWIKKVIPQSNRRGAFSMPLI